MKSYSVYVHINVINGKKYVGCTSRKPEYRWNHGKGYRNNEKFYADIEAIGWENFIHLVLYEGLEKTHAEAVETEFIKLFDSVETGYNVSYGKAFQGITRVLTEEHKKNIGNSMKGKNHPKYGKHFTEEHKKKLGDSHKKKVICLTTGEVFNSIAEGAEFYGLDYTGISKCCRGKAKTCGKLQWMYLDSYLEQLNSND